MTELLRTLISDVAANAIGAGLIGIIVSDKDGVPVLKVAGDANSSTMEGCFRQNIHWKLGQYLCVIFWIYLGIFRDYGLKKY